MIGLALALGLALPNAGSRSSQPLPAEFQGYWHMRSAPCGVYQDGYLRILGGAMMLASNDDNYLNEMEFGARRVRKIRFGYTIVRGMIRDHDVWISTEVRLRLSRDRAVLTVILPGWQGRYARCPKTPNLKSNNAANS